LNKKRHKTRFVYTITGRGLKALKNVMEINNALQIIEEENVLSIDILSESQSFSKQDFH